MHIFIREREAISRGEEPGNLYEGASPFQQVKMWKEIEKDGGTDIRDSKIVRKTSLGFQGGDKFYNLTVYQIQGTKL